MQAPRYIHGTSPEEQARLGWMHRLLNERELEQLGLAGDERVLELGAGTGVLARALAGRLPRGSVLGIELDERQLAAARAAPAVGNLELRQGDVCAPPLGDEEWGRFDLVHARFPIAVDNLHGVVHGAGEDLVRSGALGAQELHEGLRELRDWARQPAAALWYAVPLVEAVRRS